MGGGLPGDLGGGGIWRRVRRRVGGLGHDEEEKEERKKEKKRERSCKRGRRPKGKIPAAADLLTSKNKVGKKKSMNRAGVCHRITAIRYYSTYGTASLDFSVSSPPLHHRPGATQYCITLADATIQSIIHSPRVSLPWPQSPSNFLTGSPEALLGTRRHG